jgi:hypothetical protein
LSGRFSRVARASAFAALWRDASQPWADGFSPVGANESRTLAALRDALLPRLLSGELRVPAAAQAANEKNNSIISADKLKKTE